MPSKNASWNMQVFGTNASAISLCCFAESVVCEDSLCVHLAMSHLFGCMDCPRPRCHFGHGKIRNLTCQKYMPILCQEYIILLAEDGHIFLTCLQVVGTWVQHIFRNLVPDFWTCPQLVGTWLQHIMFRSCSQIFDMSLESPRTGALP